MVVEVLSDMPGENSLRRISAAISLVEKRQAAHVLVTGQEKPMKPMQSDGQGEVEVAVECRSSVNDAQQRQYNEETKHMDVDLSSMVSVPGGAVAQERVCVQRVRNEGQATVHVPSSKQRRPMEQSSVRLGKIKTTKKVATREAPRRKWKTKSSGEMATGISQTSATMLFQCTCQLLRTQTLDYDVRAREMEERNTVQTKDITEWEHKIRSLKRELEEYELDESTHLALVDATHRTVAKAGDDQRKTWPFTAPMVGTIETSLPPTVIAAETKLQEELLKRTQKVKEFCRSMSGFVQSRDEHKSRFL